MQCLACGSSWKILGDGDDTDTALTPNHVFTENCYASFRFHQEPEVFSSPSRNTGFWLWAAGLAALAILGGMTATGYRMAGIPSFESPETLQISKVEMQELVNHSGGKVFTVKGLLSNTSSNSKHIPQITIVLKKTNGSEVLRWKHKSPMPALEAGNEAWFASSIQYDTPFVAYAEASFE